MAFLFPLDIPEIQESGLGFLLCADCCSLIVYLSSTVTSIVHAKGRQQWYE